jgi:pyruvate dehydrogenase E2 component (dihydrolipoamide acetyltransferase)
MTRVPVDMPRYAPDAETGLIVRWLKQAGDAVDRGEAIVEIETDKATLEVEALVSGVLDEIVCHEDDEVAVGQVIAYIRQA